MAGTKRSSDGEEPTARPRKTAKTSSDEKGFEAGVKRKSKSRAIPRSAFQNDALPIHVNFTHTPAAVIENEDEQTTSSDPGHIGHITLLPTEFSTGSYGWKGARRITVELQGSQGKKKEKVQVMINVNATVVGSKGAADGTEEQEEEEEEGHGNVNGQGGEQAESARPNSTTPADV